MRPGRSFLAASMAVLVFFPTIGRAGDAEPCGRAHARAQVQRFVKAFNRGSFEKLDRLFAKEPSFALYRLWPEREYPASEDRSTLIQYFRERHSLDDRVRIIELLFEKRRGGDDLWGFRWKLRRRSNDPLPSGDGILAGKGAVNCRIVGWNGGWEGP